MTCYKNQLNGNILLYKSENYRCCYDYHRTSGYNNGGNSSSVHRSRLRPSLRLNYEFIKSLYIIFDSKIQKKKSIKLHENGS